jgi:hypothetical protein
MKFNTQNPVNLIYERTNLKQSTFNIKHVIL